MLTESDGPGKSSELIDRMTALNSQLREAENPLHSGVSADMRTKDAQLLREAIREMLREAAGPEKSIELADKIIYMNTRMRELDIPFQIVIEISTSTNAGIGAFKAQIMLRRTVSSTPERLIRIEPGMTAISDWLKNVGKDTEESLSIAGGLPWGSIRTVSAWSSAGNCLGSQVVQLTKDTRPGWGPLLYDIAMEAATESRGGLTADRLSVSPDAQGIWNAYDKSRPDVVKRQMDIDPAAMASSDKAYREIKPDQITPDDPSDDCSQVSAWEATDGDWISSPLSRTYSKAPTVIPKLETAGVIVRR